MNIIEIIKKRKSCRTFKRISLKPDDKRVLERFITDNTKGLGNEVLNFRIIERNDPEKQMKLNYGMIQGHSTFILGTSRSSIDSRVNYGYLMEKVVLKATEMHLSTCWIGIFDNNYFSEITVADGFEIPSIVVVGYSDYRQSYPDKLTRFSISASKRHDWGRLFFNYKMKVPVTSVSVKEYSDSLEMVRLAPSSGNTQPWRVFHDSNTKEFHFFKKSINQNYESRGLHDIDMGIALCHFELMSVENGLTGSWLKHKNVDLIDDLQYIMTWKCE